MRRASVPFWRRKVWCPTWGLVASQFNGPVPCHMEPAIYEATTARLKTLVRKTLPGTTRLMIVGHNPGLEELTHELILDGDTIALERFETKFPTGSLAVLTWPHDNWAKVTGRTAHLAHFTAPRYLT
jgi:phosphohistidine phosphatase